MFEFTCQECTKGTVVTTVVPRYETKVRGNPFTIKEAVVGICNECGAKYFDPNEIRRWRELFDADLEARGVFLSPPEIRELHTALRISLGDFARLIGSTRQSLHNWMREDRRVPQGRTADLLLRLIKRSVEVGSIDVLTLLSQLAGQLSAPVSLENRRCRSTRSARTCVAYAPPEEFDRVHNCSGQARPLPTFV